MANMWRGEGIALGLCQHRVQSLGCVVRLRVMKER